MAGLAKRAVADTREFQQLLAHKIFLIDEARFAEHAGDAGDSNAAARSRVRGAAHRGARGVLAKDGKTYDEATHDSFETGSNQAGWPTP